jgi:glycosyltransferase involved in cell wall biosynthesis
MTLHGPAVSVLMTAFNRERYIGAAIESVLTQTFTDFELVIVDDASSDATLEVAGRYAALDSRVRVVANEMNLGDYANRNHAASLARGRFLKYHDSDDLMYPHCLATMVPALEAEPQAAFAISTGWAWPGGPCPMLLSPRMCYEREFLGLGLFMAGPASGLFRTEIFRALGGFEDHGTPSDFMFWLRACKQHSALLLPADLFWYREHSGQELRGARAALERARVGGLTWLALHAADCPLDGEALERARRNYAFILAKEIWRDLRAGSLRLAAYRYRAAGLSIADWLRYVRRPQRSSRAGTPLSSDGEFMLPESLRSREERVAR